MRTEKGQANKIKKDIKRVGSKANYTPELISKVVLEPTSPFIPFYFYFYIIENKMKTQNHQVDQMAYKILCCRYC